MTANQFISVTLRITAVAATLDILAAFLISFATRHVPPVQVLQAIASGWLGVDAFRGGLFAAGIGLASHCLLMAALVTVFVWFAAQEPIALWHPLLNGVVVGVAMYAFMNLVVLPLSRIAFHPDYRTIPVMVELVVHVLCVGMPIAFLSRAYLRLSATT